MKLDHPCDVRFRHSALSSGTSDMPMAKGGKEHRSNITAQRYRVETSLANFRETPYTRSSQNSSSTADCNDIDPYARHRHTSRCSYALIHGSEAQQADDYQAALW